MKICFLGNFRPQWSSESDWLKTLRILGHEVIPIQEDETDAAQTNAAMLTHSPDVFLWVHTNGWPFNGRDRLWIESFDVTPTVMLTLDLYRGLEREADIELPHFRCKYVYTADEPDFLRSRGVNAFFSPPGILETQAYAAAPDPLHPAYGRIVFVGSRTYHKAWPWRQELLAFCEKEYGDRFQVYEHNPGVRGHALNVLYASAAVVVGDSCLASPDSRYTSDRLYETLGRGGNLVYPAINFGDLDIDHSAPCNEPQHCYGRLVETYEPGNLESLRAAVATADIWWDKAQVGGDINLTAHIRAGHTYTHRLRKILEEVKPV